MIIRVLLFASSVFFSCSIMARETTDVVVMNNGDRFTCKIKRLEAGVLYVGLDYADGDLSIDWKKIARIESGQLFIVEMQDGSVLRGTLKAVAKTDAGQPTQLEVVETPEAKQPATIEMSQVVDVRQTSEDSRKRWSGSFSSGSSYSKGNRAAQYNLGFQTLYQQERWAGQINLSSNLAANNGAKTSTRNSLNTQSYHLLPWHNYFYEGIGDFLQSSVQGIRLQTSLGAGVGRFLKNTNRTRIAAMGGLAWQSTNYREQNASQPRQNVIAGLVGMQVRLFEFSKTQLDMTAQLLPALSEPGRVRFNANASYFVKLFGQLSWNVTFYGNWDTKPPPRFSNSDYGTTSGLSWSFGR